MSFEQERVYAEDLSETPSVLRYSDILKVGTPLADLQYNTMIPSNGSTFSANQSIRIPFNVATDSFVNLKGAYLKMRVKNKNSAANGFGLDGEAGIGAFIDSWRVVSGTGAILEEVVHYNAIYALMNGMVSDNHRQSTSAILEGTSDTPLAFESYGEAYSNATGIGGRQTISQNKYYTGTHIPMSGFFNTDRLVPLGFTNGTCYVEITLAPLNTPMITNASPSGTIDWEIDQVELHLPVLRMGSEFNASFRQLLASGIPINWHSTSWHNVQSSVASGTGGSLTITTASRKRSVKSIITMFRRNADLTAIDIDSVSGRRSLAITQWNYTLGGQRMPSANVKQGAPGVRGTDDQNIGESYATLVQCLSNLGNVYSATCFTPDNWFLPDNNTSGTGSSTLCSRIAYGLDLESYGHSDVQSGKNLANQGLPIVFECALPSDATNEANTAAVLADMFLLYDVVYTLDGISGSITANA